MRGDLPAWSATRLIGSLPLPGRPPASEAQSITVLCTSIVDPRAIFHSRLHELLASFDGEVLVAWPGGSPTRASDLPSEGGLSGMASSPAGLLIDEVVSAMLLPWRLRRVDVSLVFSYNSFLLGIAAGLLARRRRAPIIFDLADDLAETAVRFVPRGFRGIAKTLARVLVGANVRLSDCTTVTTEALARQYASRARRWELLPNGVDSSAFDAVPVARASDSGRFRLVYVGTLREWLDFSPVLKAMKDLETAGIACDLTIAGEGPAEDSICEAARSAGVDSRVRFLGPVAYDRVPAVLADADACLLPFDSSAIAQAAFPLKLLEYMASRRPVIASPIPAVRRVGADVVRYAMTAADYVDAIRDLHEHRIPAARLQAGADRVRSEYSWDEARRRLREIVSQLRTS